MTRAEMLATAPDYVSRRYTAEQQRCHYAGSVAGAARLDAERRSGTWYGLTGRQILERLDRVWERAYSRGLREWDSADQEATP